MKTIERTITTNGSTLSPGESSVYSLNIVPLEPPAPAARVELGFWTVFCARRLTCPAPGGRETAAEAAPGLGAGPEGEVGLDSSEDYHGKVYGLATKTRDFSLCFT